MGTKSAKGESAKGESAKASTAMDVGGVYLGFSFLLGSNLRCSQGREVIDRWAGKQSALSPGARSD